GARFVLVERNDVAGGGDYPFLSLAGDAEQNRYERNRCGPAYTSDPHFVHDFGVAGSSCYFHNEYCHAHEEYEGDGVDLDCSQDFEDRHCDGLEVRCPKAPQGPRCASSMALTAPDAGGAGSPSTGAEAA